jgi:hypothetical protein
MSLIPWVEFAFRVDFRNQFGSEPLGKAYDVKVLLEGDLASGVGGGDFGNGDSAIPVDKEQHSLHPVGLEVEVGAEEKVGGGGFIKDGSGGRPSD